jgi:hypothetical protein
MTSMDLVDHKPGLLGPPERFGDLFLRMPSRTNHVGALQGGMVTMGTWLVVTRAPCSGKWMLVQLYTTSVQLCTDVGADQRLASTPSGRRHVNVGADNSPGRTSSSTAVANYGRAPDANRMDVVADRIPGAVVGRGRSAFGAVAVSDGGFTICRP